MKLFSTFLFAILSCHCVAQIYSIIPAPVEMTAGKGVFEINSDTKFIARGSCIEEAKLFVEWFNHATGNKFEIDISGSTPSENFVMFNSSKVYDPTNAAIVPKLPGDLNKYNVNINPDAYTLQVDQRGILISATYNQGVFSATQTFRQMLPVVSESGQLRLPTQLTAVTIRDQPKFKHRGFLLDCCRHFMSTDFIRKYIDLLALYKMNVLHWHLTEDQGWRIEIKKYPELTTHGSWRTDAKGNRYGGFYSQEEIKEIVRYAQSRHIMIIPEIELPGHSVAAISTYPWLSCTGKKIPVETEWGVFKDIYCAGNDSTFIFLENVLSEICELFPSPYIHIGGDEAPSFRWENCNKCQKRIHDEHLHSAHELQSWFVSRVAKFLSSKGKKIIGWDEILGEGIPADATIQSWRSIDEGVKAVTAGHDVVMSPTSHCYFDYGLESTDLKEVYFFDPIPGGLTPAQTSHIIGGECNLWTEHAPQDKVDAKVFPRILAMSEVLWTYPEQRNYDLFFQKVIREYDRLNYLDVNCGLPGVPVSIQSEIIDNGVMKLTPQFNYEGISLNYELMPLQGNNSRKGKFSEPILIKESTKVVCTAVYKGESYDSKLTFHYDPHIGIGKKLELSYTPSPNYTGGGTQALSDGQLGILDFRDGHWQAVAGKDMEVIMDLGSEMKIQTVMSNWYHYGNAWIFRPETVTYAVSTDGKIWTELKEIKTEINLKTVGESIVPFVFTAEKINCRYIKMIARSSGPCPEWHDAPGEPSWLFVDELIVK